jgi:hypothetical protein
MALPEVFLTGYYENQVTSNPLDAFISITPKVDSMVDQADDKVLSQGGSIALVEGAFRISLPEGDYSAKVVVTGNPRREVAAVEFTLLQAEATAVTEPVDPEDPESELVTFYEKDISDFYTP